MNEHIKYPRTFHLPYSLSKTDDDKTFESDDLFKSMNKVYCSIKMDGENCLRKDVKIFTNKGQFTIEEIVEKKLKVLVLTLNEKKVLEYQPIEKYIKNSECYEWYDIELENGQHLYVTEEHLLFLPELNEYKSAKNLKVNDKILYKDY